MRKSTLVGGLAAALASMVLVLPPPTDAAAPTDNTGSIYSDLVVALRDVDGVPITDTYPVPDAAPETCVHPVSYSPLPLVTTFEINPVDGRKVWLIPLVGDAPGEFDLAEFSVCDPQPAYAMYVSEAELERLNLTRTQDTVIDRKTADVAAKLLAAERITLDGAGRITTWIGDVATTIDAAPEQAAIYRSLMDTGSIPGLPIYPGDPDANAATAWIPQEGMGFDNWMLAAAAIGTAASKSVPITIDTVEYYNRVASPDGGVADWNYAPVLPDVVGEQFVDYTDFSYTRSEVFQGCSTWLDVPTLTWKTAKITDIVHFTDVVAGAATGQVTNVAGFTQMADDVRSVIVYLHENEVVVPGFYLDPVFVDTCPEQQAALTNPAVMWGGMPTDLIQTDTVTVDTSAFMPWAGFPVAEAQFRLTIDAVDPFTGIDQVTAIPAGGTPVGFNLVGDDLVGVWPDPGFALDRGDNLLTNLDLTVAGGAPIGAYTMTLQLLDDAGDPTGAADVETVNVLPGQPTVLWTSTADYVAQGSYFPMTARVFNPPTGIDVAGASLRVTIVPPDPTTPFLSASQVASWSEAVAMPFNLEGTNLVGEWSLDDPLLSGDPLTAGVDQLITWYLNVADGAPTGVYAIGVEIIKEDGAPLVPSTSDTASVNVAAAPTHGGSGGGGGGSDGGDGGAPPSLQITSSPAVTTSATDATLVFSTDATTVLCGLDGAAPTSCTSPVTYTGLPVGSHIFSVVAVAADGQYASASYAWTIVPVVGEDSMITSFTPVRLADTRPGWVAADGLFVGTGPVPGGQFVQVSVANRGGVPADATAAVLNVTVVSPAGDGYATVYPCGTLPTASSVNYSAGEDVANEVMTKLSPTGTVCVFTYSTANIIIDVAGFVPALSDYVPMNPVRVADTRAGWVAGDGLFAGTGPVASGQFVQVPVAGRAGVPADAKAVVVNVTSVSPAGGGYLTVFPCGTLPYTSSLNYSAGEDVANEVIAKLSPTGAICVFTSATANIIVDVAGYVPAGSDYVGLDPVRLADTRAGWVAADGLFAGTGPVAGGQFVQVPVAGRGGVPADARSVVANVTIADPVAGGYATVFPCGTLPYTSSLNYSAGEAVANEVIAKLSPTGSICVFTYSTANIIVDVAGYM